MCFTSKHNERDLNFIGSINYLIFNLLVLFEKWNSNIPKHQEAIHTPMLICKEEDSFLLILEVFSLFYIFNVVLNAILCEYTIRLGSLKNTETGEVPKIHTKNKIH